MIKKLRLVAILGFTLVVLHSCGNKPTRADKVKFISEVYIQLSSISKNMENISAEFQTAADKVDTSANKRLDDATVASLTDSYAKKLSEIEASISKIDALKEVDKEANVKQKTLDYVKESKDLVKSIMDLTLKLLREGPESITDDEKTQIKDDLDHIDQMESKGDALNNDLEAFVAKNKITDQELKDNGATDRNIFK